jgi:Tol biopolymer transport system component
MFRSPRVSPDGQRVAFTGALELPPPGTRTPPKTGVFVVNIDGSGLTKFPTGLASAWDAEWSPDGRQIAFGELPNLQASPDSAVSAIYIADVNGSSRRLVARVKGFIQWPSWSPDGRFIAYQTFTGGKDANILLLDVASANVKTITRHDRPYLDETPKWTSDGRLLFQSTRDGAYEVYIMNADGSDQRRVSQVATALQTEASANATPTAPAGATALAVTNAMPHAMTVTAEVNGQSRSLGAVEAGKSRIFALDDTLVGAVSLTAQLEGTLHRVEGKVTVQKGRTVTFTIQ